MKPAPFAYHRPASLDEALALLAHVGPNAKLIAGGQSMVPMLNLRLTQTEQLIDLNDLTEWARIREHGERLEIGFLTRHAQLVESRLLRQHCPLVTEMAQTIAILKDRPSDFLVVSGDDEIVMAQIACGMDGVISVAANAFPKPFSDMIRYCMAGDFSMAKRLNDLMVEGYSYMYEENNPSGIKAYLFEQGIIENEFRLPLVPVSAGLQQKIHDYLQKYFA